MVATLLAAGETRPCMRPLSMLLIAVSLMGLAGAPAAVAQVGVIIIPKEPGQARELARESTRFAARVRLALARGPLDQVTRDRVVLVLRDLVGRARTIKERSKRGLLLSSTEERSITRSLESIRESCKWIKDHALTSSGPSGP